MKAELYQYIEIDGVSIAYTDQGQGQTLLFVHGFASFSHAWTKLIDHFPEGYRSVTIDLKGFGNSAKICDDELSLFDQGRILKEFVHKLKLDDFVLVGHSMGGAVSLISMFAPDIRNRVKRLILIACAGYFEEVPDFMNALKYISPDTVLGRFTNEELIVSLILEQAFFDNSKIEEEMVKLYADFLREENSKECLLAAAKQISIANARAFREQISCIDTPTLIIWGQEDGFSLPENDAILTSDFEDVELRWIPQCGHFPHEEYPQEIADMMVSFIRQPTDAAELEAVLTVEAPVEEPPLEKTQLLPKRLDELVHAPTNYIRKLRMRRLVDRWSIGTLIIIMFVKFLQVLKTLGFKARENGWRRVTGIFLRKEHSKFILAGFRFNYLSGIDPFGYETSKEIVVQRFAKFIKKVPDSHWAFEWGFFEIKRKKLVYTDVIEATFTHGGELTELVPHFDPDGPDFELPDDLIIEGALAEFIRVYNDCRHLDDQNRPHIIQKRMMKWARRQMRWSYTGPQRVSHYVQRLLDGTFIQFEILPEDPAELTMNRMHTPNMKNRRHPGLGLLNVVCRFTHDLTEVDLWVQHHHVPVDGMPMQEMLQKLKEEWGEVGPVHYPALSQVSRPELHYAGNGIFRARLFLCFDRFLKLRKRLNEEYFNQMGGSATVSSMMIWGLAQSKSFQGDKFVFPVDTSLVNPNDQSRDISLIFIRPGEFADAKDPLSGFIKYQREFNHRMFATRQGRSESYELLELYSMMHPLFYYIARYFMPKATEEVVGTAGLTILRDAEMFVSPLTDLQTKGFVALGNLRMPTEDGGKAGAVSICGPKSDVFSYIEAIRYVVESLPECLGVEVQST